MGGQRGCKSSISLVNQAKNLLSWSRVGSTICQNAARSLSSLCWIAPKVGAKIRAGKLSRGGKEKEERVREVFSITASQ